ncbi:NotI family restriction endonuclease [Varunaivibrio sulfuroxidans]|uniref:Restriction endonuclease NotI n=1 Tax=Varunaivibrio sulfuroxidans TaxID=1773489 RepID=A0A4R3JIP7_9PROT|nr:NotI family restriction endonuclease [Varunaivibrio sulfuroxidans]TCS64680.1 restriction endonuclease NotI [Varunaivibrio sulfuroxidans]WES30013.1 NotI family restriction endonuclease [Varunaivibrio sulfuroxidans]
MALSVSEFFGFTPLDPQASEYVQNVQCPFVGSDCIKPSHGACAVRQITSDEAVICCPNRMYAENYGMLEDVATEAFGPGVQLVAPDQASILRGEGKLTDKHVCVFGRYFGRELPLPKPMQGAAGQRNYYMDWILARLLPSGEVQDLTALEVQTIDTTGNYSDQAGCYFNGQSFTDPQGRTPGYSNAGLNWENVNKRILPQLIYKGHVLRRERLCSKGLFFVCPHQVYERIRERLGNHLHEYQPGNGTITFRSYGLGTEQTSGSAPLVFTGQLTTTVDQVALAFTAPMNLPDQNVYESAVNNALSKLI